MLTTSQVSTLLKLLPAIALMRASRRPNMAVSLKVGGCRVVGTRAGAWAASATGATPVVMMAVSPVVAVSKALTPTAMALRCNLPALSLIWLASLLVGSCSLRHPLDRWQMR